MALTQQEEAKLDEAEDYGLEYPDPLYDTMYRKWYDAIKLMEGKDGLMEDIGRYLPQEPAESDAAYKVRIRRSSLYNVFRKTVQSAAGQALQQGVVIKNVPKELEFLEENATGDGRTMTEIAYDLIEDHLLYGKAHGLVDFPNTASRPMSYAEFKRSGFRPYVNIISPVDLIGWKYHLDYGYPKLTNIRIVEAEVSDNPWSSTVISEKKTVRAYFDDFVYKYTYNEDEEEYVEEDMYINSLGTIPLVTGYSNKVSFMIAYPPLEDLVHVNLAHFQSASDQRNILHIARVPFILAKGFKEQELDNVEIGPNRIVTTTNAEADMDYVEHTGAAIEAGERDLAALEKQMEVLGASLIMDRSVDRQTATARQIDQAESTSLMQLSVRSTENMIRQFYILAGMWLGVDASDVDVSIGSERTLAQEPNPTSAVRELRDLNLMSDEQLFNEAKMRGVISQKAKFDPNAVEKEPQQEMQQDETNEEETNVDGVQEREEERRQEE